MSVSGGRPGAADEPRIADIMTGRPITVHPEATVKQLADLLRASHQRRAGGRWRAARSGCCHRRRPRGRGRRPDVSALHPVLDSLIYLESTKKFEERLKKAVGARVADIMTAEVISVHRDDEMRVAATLMSEQRINLVPVVDDHNKLVGVVTRHDIVAGLGL